MVLDIWYTINQTLHDDLQTKTVNEQIHFKHFCLNLTLNTNPLNLIMSSNSMLYARNTYVLFLLQIKFELSIMLVLLYSIKTYSLSYIKD